MFDLYQWEMAIFGGLTIGWNHLFGRHTDGKLGMFHFNQCKINPAIGTF